MKQKILSSDLTIIVDNREFSSRVVKELTILGCRVQAHQLPVGDYILSDRVCVERKSSSDFVGSIFNGRIFEQVRNLKTQFEKPVLMIEGNNIYAERDAHPNSIRGALASIAIDYGIPILWTDSPEETAAMLFWIAKREQEEIKVGIAIRGERPGESLPKKQEYLVAGLPGINTKMARRLLKELKTPERIFKASEGRLKKTEGIAEKKAKVIREILETEYKQDI